MVETSFSVVIKDRNIKPFANAVFKLGTMIIEIYKYKHAHTNCVVCPNQLSKRDLSHREKGKQKDSM